MPRHYDKKGVHTSPEKAGRQNITPEIEKSLPKDEDNINAKIMPIYKQGMINRGVYKGQWTDEQLAQAIADLFDYCASVNLKPTQPALRLWLGVHRDTIHAWRTQPEKYGVKSDLIRWALDAMELYLQANIDKYPTGSAFLLRTSFGHVETSKLDVNATGNVSTSTDEVNDLVSKLGLDKK